MPGNVIKLIKITLKNNQERKWNKLHKCTSSVLGTAMVTYQYN